jgi:hypothetical protein
VIRCFSTVGCRANNKDFCENFHKEMKIERREGKIKGRKYLQNDPQT